LSSTSDDISVLFENTDFLDFSFFLINADTGAIVHHNQTALDRLDYEPSELNSCTFQEISRPIFEEISPSNQIDFLLEESPLSFKTTLLTKSDSEIPVQAQVDRVNYEETPHLLIISDRAEMPSRISSQDQTKLRDNRDRSEPDNQEPSTLFSNLKGTMSVEFTQELLDKTRDEIYVFDVETGNVLEANETASLRLGYNHEQLRGMNITEFVDTFDSIDDWKNRIEDYRSGSASTVEGFHIRQNGSRYPVEVNSTLVRDDDREFLISIARDITERRRREKESRRLFHAVNDAITVHDPEKRRLVDVNETFADMLGYTREDIIEMGVSGFSDQSKGYTEEKANTVLDRVVETDSVEPFEWAVEDADGNTLWFEVNATTLEWDGKPQVLTISRNITERKHNRETLRYRKSLLEAQQQAADEGILAVDPDNNILSYNEQFQEIWDLPDEIMESRDDDAALNYVLDKLENPDEFLDTVQTLYDNPFKSQRDEIRLKDGRVLERFTAPIQYDDEFLGRVWFFRDITEKRQVKDRLEESLREKETLIEEIHHRVKNNIQIIISMLKMQSRDFESDELMDAFQDSINRMETMALIHEELYQSEHLSDVNFPAYIKSLCRRLSQSHYRSKDTELRLEIDSIKLDLETAIACGLLVNELVTNAFEHGMKNTKNGSIIVRFNKTDDEIVFEVSDDGEGLPEGFDLDTVESTGLKIVRSLAEFDLDGELEFIDDDGLTVRVKFEP
jgi:PAS domain S-box-containing protein